MRAEAKARPRPLADAIERATRDSLARRGRCALRRLVWALPALPLLAGSCANLDPAAELTVTDIETHWAIDPSVAGNSYLAPVVRFQVRNKGTQLLRSVEARARFWRTEQAPVDWGGGGAYVSTWRKPMQPGQGVPVVLKSDGRYNSTGPPEQMLKNPSFRDARAEIFLRIGASPWFKFADVAIERRIGARSVTEQMGEASPH